MLDAVYLYEGNADGDQEELLKTADNERTNSEITSFTYDRDLEHLTRTGSYQESSQGAGSLKRVGVSIGSNDKPLLANRAPMDTIIEEDDIQVNELAASKSSIVSERSNSEMFDNMRTLSH